jgi:hypothetical protein
MLLEEGLFLLEFSINLKLIHNGKENSFIFDYLETLKVPIIHYLSPK